jgi:thiol-disulfide isomerase/thioredoxin
MRPIRLAGLGVLLTFLVVPAFAQDKVDVRTMKYDDLTKLIRDNRGKVVVVDVWFYACKPCKEEGIPNLIRLHDKYAKDGLVAVTVQVDDEQKDREKGAKWLRDNKVPAINVTLDESGELANKKMRLTSFPTLFVFNRDGKFVQFPRENEDKIDPQEVDKLVLEFLKKK